MSTTLQLTRASDTIDLNDGTTYQLLAGWVPKIASRRGSITGNSSPWDDVTEVIPIRILGASVGAVLSAIHDLTVMFDHANRRANFDDTAETVLLKWAPDGASGGALSAFVLGPEGGSLQQISLDPDWDQTLGKFQITTKLSIRRHGIWIGADDTGGTTAAAVEMVNTYTTDSLTAVDLPSPTDISIEIQSGTFSRTKAGFILFADGTSGFQIIEAEDLVATNAKYSSQTSTNNASSDAFARYAPTDESEQGINTSSLSWGSPQRLAVYAVIAGDAGGVNFQVRASVKISTGEQDYYTRYRVVDSATYGNAPQAMFIGIIELPGKRTISDFQFYATCEDATGGPTLDIDVIVLQEVSETTGAVFLRAQSDTGNTYDEFSVLHREDAWPVPRVYQRTSGGDITDKPYQGNAYFLSKSTSVQTVLIQPGNSNWRLDNTGGADITYKVAVTRKPLYLIPG